MMTSWTPILCVVCILPFQDMLQGNVNGPQVYLIEVELALASRNVLAKHLMSQDVLI